MNSQSEYTHSGEGVVQIVNSPSNDYNVIDIEPKRQNGSSQTHTCNNQKIHGSRLNLCKKNNNLSEIVSKV